LAHSSFSFVPVSTSLLLSHDAIPCSSLQAIYSKQEAPLSPTHSLQLKAVRQLYIRTFLGEPLYLKV